MNHNNVSYGFFQIIPPSWYWWKVKENNKVLLFTHTAELTSHENVNQLQQRSLHQCILLLTDSQPAHIFWCQWVLQKTQNDGNPGQRWHFLFYLWSFGCLCVWTAWDIEGLNLNLSPCLSNSLELMSHSASIWKLMRLQRIIFDGKMLGWRSKKMVLSCSEREEKRFLSESMILTVHYTWRSFQQHNLIYTLFCLC